MWEKDCEKKSAKMAMKTRTENCKMFGLIQHKKTTANSKRKNIRHRLSKNVHKCQLENQCQYVYFALSPSVSLSLDCSRGILVTAPAENVSCKNYRHKIYERNFRHSKNMVCQVTITIYNVWCLYSCILQAKRNKFYNNVDAIHSILKMKWNANTIFME